MSEHEDPKLLFKALAKLRGIKSNIDPKRYETQEKYAHEYNQTVQEIAKAIGDNLDTFLVSDQNIKPTVSVSNYLTGEKHYSEDSWVETQLLLTKVDSLISYMEMLLGQEKPKPPFGFSDK